MKSLGAARSESGGESELDNGSKALAGFFKPVNLTKSRNADRWYKGLPSRDLDAGKGIERAYKEGDSRPVFRRTQDALREHLLRNDADMSHTFGVLHLKRRLDLFIDSNQRHTVAS